MERAKVLAVFRNEWQQTFTAGRMAGWLLICAVPVLLTFMVSQSESFQSELGFQVGTSGNQITTMWTIILFFVCEIVCLLQLLLWATPWLYSELEGKTWSYLAVRPGGKSAVLLGKYFAAATRTMLGTLLALSLALLIARPVDGWKVFLVLGFIMAISSFSYAALFVLLGAVFPKRSMVLAVGYSLVIEFLVPRFPAIINQLSLQFRIRSTLRGLLELVKIEGEWKISFAYLLPVHIGFEDPNWYSEVLLHLSILVIVTFALVAIANQLIRRCEQVLKAEV